MERCPLKPVIVTDVAEEEIAGAAEYIRNDRGVDAASTFNHALYATFQRIAEHPALGRQRDDVRPGLRFFPLLAYNVFYDEHPGHVEIVRVLHQRRDIASAFAERGKGPRRS